MNAHRLLVLGPPAMAAHAVRAYLRVRFGWLATVAEAEKTVVAYRKNHGTKAWPWWPGHDTATTWLRNHLPPGQWAEPLVEPDLRDRTSCVLHVGSMTLFDAQPRWLSGTQYRWPEVMQFAPKLARSLLPQVTWQVSPIDRVAYRVTIGAYFT
jgi:hypothetical protein